jgi:hypothetical protein
VVAVSCCAVVIRGKLMSYVVLSLRISTTFLVLNLYLRHKLLITGKLRPAGMRLKLSC